MANKKPFNVEVAEKVIDQLKRGTSPFQHPWQAGTSGVMPMNPTTGKRYKGINTLVLKMEEMEKGYSDNRWLTYNQAQKIGGQVRRGEHGTTIQHWKFKEEQNVLDDQGRLVIGENGKPKKEIVDLERPKRFLAKVFNASQIDGMPPREPREPRQKWEAVERAENILKNSGANIRHDGGDNAFYRPSTDSVHLPDRSAFPSAENYYAVALHEIGHWTGHPSRLDRDFAHPFGSEGYAREELRAELSSMIMGDELDIGYDPGQHVAYVGSWIRALEEDPNEIFRASADAEKISRYMLAYEQVQEKEQEQAQTQTVVQEPQQEQIRAEAPATDFDEEIQTKLQRTYINVPFKEKQDAKSLGARWDRQERSWYVPEGVGLGKFDRWRVQVQQAEKTEQEERQVNIPRQERHYLAVPYSERNEAKALGAQWDKAAKSWYVGENASKDALKRWDPNNAKPQQDPAMSPQEEFADAMRSVGLTVPQGHPVMDGKPHRVPVEDGKRGARDGFYVGHLDGLPAGMIANNKTGEELKWKSKGYSLSESEKAQLQATAAAKLEERAKQQEEAHNKIADKLQEQVKHLQQPVERTPYLEKKGVQLYEGVYTDKTCSSTIIPAMDANGKHWTTQYIQEDGSKRFAKDGKKEGTFHAIGGMEKLEKAPVLIIAEGYATAATLAEISNQSVVAAFDSGNLGHVAKALHEKFPDKPIIIAGDNDMAQELERGKNPGKEKAMAAAESVGGKAIFPVFAKSEQEGNPKGFSDFNDLATKSILGKEGVDRQLLAAIESAKDRSQERQQANDLANALAKQQKHKPRGVRL